MRNAIRLLFVMLSVLSTAGLTKADNAIETKGEKALAKADYDLAISCFDEAIRLNPQSASAYEGRSSAYFNKRDFKQAIADATEAVRLAPVPLAPILPGGTPTCGPAGTMEISIRLSRITAMLSGSIQRTH